MQKVVLRETPRRLKQKQPEEEIINILSGETKTDATKFAQAVATLERRAEITFRIKDDCLLVDATFHGTTKPVQVWGIRKSDLPMLHACEFDELYSEGGKSRRANVEKYQEGHLPPKSREEIRKNPDKVWAFLLAQFKLDGKNLYSGLKGGLICKLINILGPSTVKQVERSVTRQF